MNVHALIATGVNSDGHREILGLDVASSEDGAGCWRSCAACRPRPVRRAAGHLRLPPRAAGRDRPVLPGASWQRCRAHYARNLRHQSAQVRPAVGLHPGPDHLRAARRRLGPRPAPPGRHRSGGQVPLAAAHLDDARDDILAFTAFPREIWRQIWSNNPQERLNKEIRRAPTWSGSSRPATPSSALSAPSWPTDDEWTEDAAISAPRSSPPPQSRNMNETKERTSKQHKIPSAGSLCTTPPDTRWLLTGPR